MEKKHTLTSLVLHHRRSLITGLVALTIVDLSQLVIPLIIQRAVDTLTIGDRSAETLTRYALYIVALGIIMSVFRFSWRYHLLGASRRVEQIFRNRFFSHLQHLSNDFFARRSTGDLMAHTVNDIEAIRMACGLGVVIAYDGVLLLVFIIGAMFYISPVLATFALAPFPVLGIVIYLFGQSIERRFTGVQDRFSELTEAARQTLSGIKVVKAFVREERELEDFTKSSRDYLDSNLTLIKLTGVYQPVITLFAGVAMGIFLLVGGRQAILNEITLGDFAAVLVYLGMLSWPMLALGWAVDITRRGNASLTRVNGILALQPEVEDMPGARDAEIEGDIEFRDVTYTYPGGRAALRGLSLSVERGESLGISGATASGKTTLLKLLVRLIEPGPGQILVNSGTDILDIKRAGLRKGIVFIPQETTVFSGTVRDNIAFMNPALTDEDIVRAARTAEIYDDIMGFPEGFDTPVGERGLTLSGGQRQRLALARALLMNPAVLVLDDVLSSLDLHTESLVLRNLRREMSGRTLIAISSRVPSISGFERIAVLDEGRLAELGTHTGLMAAEGIYARLYALQTMSDAA